MNINKLLRDFPRLAARVEVLEKALGVSPVDTGTQVPVTLPVTVSERSPQVTEGPTVGKEPVRKRRGSTRSD